MIGIIFIVPVGIMVAIFWRLLPSMTKSNAADSAHQRQHLWWRRISAGALIAPGIVVLAFIALVFWHFYGSGPTLRPYFPFFARAAIVWKISSAIGLLSSLRAAQFARWSGPDLELAAVHVCSIFFIWIAPQLPYAFRGD
jgi:hypothetical protein